LSKISEALPGLVIMTDDPMRARMLSAHHLEYSTLIYESGDILVYSGSYNGVPIALVSTGFGSGAVLSYLRELKAHGVKEIIYIGACVSTSARHGLRSVILSDGGGKSLLGRAYVAAKHCEISISTQAVMPKDGTQSGKTGIIDGVTGALYEQAKADGIEVLSVLTVSENTATGEILDDHERRSRFYAASRLVFEIFGIA